MIIHHLYSLKLNTSANNQTIHRDKLLVVDSKQWIKLGKKSANKGAFTLINKYLVNCS